MTLTETASPSCRAAEALDRQGPFVNPTLSNHALALLGRLFHYGTVSYHGGFVGLLSLATVQGLRVDPGHWQRLRRKVGWSGRFQSATLPYWQNLASVDQGCYSSAKQKIEPFSLIS